MPHEQKPVMAKMQGCSHCTQMESQIKNAGMGAAPFQVVTCHGQGATPDHPACKNTNAFPAFFNKQGQECHKGAGDLNQIMQKCGVGKK